VDRGRGGESYHLTGGSWSLVTTPTTNSLNAVWGTGSTQLWAVGDAGTMIQGDGTGWTPITAVTSANLEGLWGSAANDVWAVGGSTAAAVIVHLGSGWSVWPGIASTLALAGVWGADSTHVWAVGQPASASGTPPILFWNGTSWSADDLGSADNLAAVWGTSATNVWAVGTAIPGSEARISHFNGAGWTSTSTLADPLTGVTGVGTSDTWVVGSYGAILHR
jgi:hypothetical protein